MLYYGTIVAGLYESHDKLYQIYHSSLIYLTTWQDVTFESLTLRCWVISLTILLYL